jgi:AraC-like DNA-binding protein
LQQIIENHTTTMTELTYYISLAATALELMLAILIFISMHKPESANEHKRRTGLFIFYGLSTLLAFHTALQIKNTQHELLNEYDIVAVFTYMFFLCIFFDNLFGYKWYKYYFIWVTCSAPSVFLIGSRLYFDNYLSINTSFNSWEEIISQFSMQNIVLITRFVLTIYTLITLSSLFKVVEYYFDYRTEMKRNNEQAPAWIPRLFHTSWIVGCCFLIGTIISAPIYHLLKLLVLIAGSLYLCRDFVITRHSTRGEVTGRPCPTGDPNDSIQMEMLTSEIDSLLRQEPFPLADRNITTVKVARRLNVKTSNFEYYLDEILQLPFNKWVNQQKLYYCCRLLKETELPLGNIATLAGYNDLSAMSKAFKRKYNITPSDYRRDR